MDGAPFLPLDRNDKPDVIMESKSDEGRDHIYDHSGDDYIANNHDEDEQADRALCNCQQTSMGLIQRTFSFDEQLPMVYHRGTSIRSLSCTTPILEDDFYVDEQPSITIPVTYSKDNKRSKLVYPISIP